jgi:hypothetical protein
MTATDTFEAYAYVPTAPANGAFAVTQDDDAALPKTTRELYVGGAGDVAVVMRDGSEATFSVPAGTSLRVAASKVKATATTATGIVGLY